MTKRAWAKFTLAVPLLLTGCNGFWDAQNNGGGGGKTTLSSGNFYVLNIQANQIAGYTVKTGVLTPLSGSPYAIPAQLFSFSAITIGPNNSFLYVSTLNGIYVYTISTNGALTIGNSSNPISADKAVSMQVDSTSSWLVDVATAAPYIYAIPISPSTGINTSTNEAIRPLPVGTVNQMVISPDNGILFVAMGAGGTAVIPFNAANTNPIGTVGSIAVKNAGGAALSVAVDPLALPGQTTPRFFYIGETAATTGTNTGGLRIFNFSPLQEISGSPLATQGLAPHWILPKFTGDYVYVANRQTSAGSTGVIAGYSITSANSTYTFSALSSTFAAGTNPQALAEDNSGNFVFAVNYGGNPDLIGYTLDAKNGGFLDNVISAATGIDPALASTIGAAH
jgi:6-phosphogluconolactonase (cycloisomerase 2 family)